MGYLLPILEYMIGSCQSIDLGKRIFLFTYYEYLARDRFNRGS